MFAYSVLMTKIDKSHVQKLNQGEIMDTPSVIMPQCACASKVYGSVCVCVDCYSCSRINEVQVRVSIGF